MCAFLVAANLNNALPHILQDAESLIARAAQQEFLAEVVPIRVCHELAEAASDLLQQELHKSSVCLCQLLLQEARARLR